MASETEAEWGATIAAALERNLQTLLSQGLRHKSRAISLYPFLKVLSTQDYVRIIIQVKPCCDAQNVRLSGALHLNL